MWFRQQSGNCQVWPRLSVKAPTKIVLRASDVRYPGPAFGFRDLAAPVAMRNELVQARDTLASLMLTARLMKSNMKLKTTSEFGSRQQRLASCCSGMRQPFGSMRKKANASGDVS